MMKLESQLPQLISEWLSHPEDQLCGYQISGSRIISHTTNTTTVAVRYTNDGQEIVITTADFPHHLFGRDTRVGVVERAVANKIYAFFNLEFNVLRTGKPFNSPSEDERILGHAIIAFRASGLPLPKRLARAAPHHDRDHRAAMVLTAFCDVRIAQRYRYGVWTKDGFVGPTRLQGSSFSDGDWVIYEQMDDAVQAKMLSTDVAIIDLWGEPDAKT